MKLHALPWPRDELAAQLDTPVTLRGTLSYFIEPNPGAREWTTKFGYQSHRLRFFVKRAQESAQAFEKRINKVARGRQPAGHGPMPPQPLPQLLHHQPPPATLGQGHRRR